MPHILAEINWEDMLGVIGFTNQVIKIFWSDSSIGQSHHGCARARAAKTGVLATCECNRWRSCCAAADFTS